jgi:hypothetical protein
MLIFRVRQLGDIELSGEIARKPSLAPVAFTPARTGSVTCTVGTSCVVRAPPFKSSVVPKWGVRAG